VSDPSTETISNESPGSGRRVGPSAWSTSTPGLRTTALTAALSLVLAGGGATAAYRGLQSPDEAFSLVPASAFAVAAVDLSLPGGQDDSIASFADHFPDSVVRDGSGSTVDRILRAMFRDSSDPHVDYDDDLAPWLGDHVAVAGWLDHGSPRLEVLVESTDDGSAREHLTDVMGADGGLVVRDGYAVISDTREHASDALTAAATKSLADSSTFTADMSRLPDDEAAIGWFDGPAVKDALAGVFDGMGSGALMGGLGMFGLPNADKAFAARVAAGIHVTDDTAQLDLYQVGGDLPETTRSSRLTALPDKTIAAFEIGAPGPIVDAAVGAVRSLGALVDSGSSGGCASVHAMPPVGVMVAPGTPHRHRILRELRKARRQARQGPTPGATATPVPSEGYQPYCQAEPAPAPTDPLDAFGSATGLTLPDDLKTMLGDASVVSYGGLQIGGLPDVAIRSHPTDLDAARTLAETLRTHLSSSAGIDLAVREADGDLVLATSTTYADQVATEGRLGDQETAALALGDVPAEVADAGFVDLSRIWPVTGISKDDNVAHLRAFGFWAARDGSVLHTQLRLVVG
jgi:hypothetical protein